LLKSGTYDMSSLKKSESGFVVLSSAGGAEVR
jgi:hypothetical protein